jgi:hypothetical protein
MKNEQQVNLTNVFIFNECCLNKGVQYKKKQVWNFLCSEVRLYHEKLSKPYQILENA